MSTPVSGAGNVPPEPPQNPPSPAVEPENGAATEPPNQPAFRRLPSGKPPRAASGGASGAPRRALPGPPEGMPRAQSGVPAPSSFSGGAGVAPGRSPWRTVVPTCSFIGGIERVRGPEGYNVVVGSVTENGMMLMDDGREIGVHEAMAMPLAMGWATDHFDRDAPFYLAIGGPGEAGVAEFAQRWATISGKEVIVQDTRVTRDAEGRSTAHGVGPLGRFLPAPLSRPITALRVENGEMVEVLDTGNRAVDPLEYLGERVGSDAFGAEYRFGENFVAKIYSPDVNARLSIERGGRVLDRLAAQGFRVETRLGGPKELPSGFILRYLPLGSGSADDFIARGDTLSERAVDELRTMRDLIVKNRPFHADRECIDPEISFDRHGLPYIRIGDSVDDTTRGRVVSPDVPHGKMLGTISKLLELASSKAAQARVEIEPVAGPEES